MSKIGQVLRDGMWLLPVDAWQVEHVPIGAMVEVPPESYLREFRDTPADDLDALADLCTLGPIRPIRWPYEDLPINDDAVWKRVLWQTGFRDWRGDEREREEVAERHRPDGILASPVHAAEVAYRVRAMQRTTDHLLAYLAGEPVASAWRDCRDEQDAWHNFVRTTSAALRDFQVRVDVEIVGVKPHGADDLQIGEVFTTTYSAAMLQLVNDLATNETVRICANETCRRPFVRQLGRTAYGGHRKIGTLYCSSNCARAQYQREKRRRDRAAREERQG